MRKRDKPLAHITAFRATATVDEAISATVETRWANVRSAKWAEGQAVLGFSDVARYALGMSATCNRTLLRSVPLSEMTTERIAHTVTNLWVKGRDMTAVSVNARLDAMSCCGAHVTGLRLTRPKKLKWWLNPDDATRLDKWLRDRDRHDTADYIQWTCHTGLRVEESLALTRRHFFEDTDRRLEVTVPGTKTRSAQATLPLNAVASQIVRKRFSFGEDPEDRLFPVTYRLLAGEWQECRAFLGHGFDRGVTLKALRRSFARVAQASGMPLDMLREYLRHEDLETTMEYLRLVGSYRSEEFRKFLK